ncbi:MAG: MBL fold metallo-hydrolase [Gammaproteobacteria bacterium]
MKLRVLGCSGGIGADLRTTSLLIDDDILIDAGTGVSELSLEEMSKIRHVFLTHSHLDHITCLPLMVDSIFELILKQPITIYSQQATIEALHKHIFNWAIWPDFATLPTSDNPVMKYQVLTPGEVVTINERKVELIPVNHIVPAAGYRVECNGRSFAFSGDTAENDTLWNALNAHKGLDLLLVEAAFSNADEQLSLKARHYCPKILAGDLLKLKHNPDIYITHNKPGGEEIIFQECQDAIKDRKLFHLRGNQEFNI